MTLTATQKLARSVNNVKGQLKIGMTRGTHPRLLSQLEVVSLQNKLMALEMQLEAAYELKRVGKAVEGGVGKVIAVGSMSEEELQQQGVVNKRAVGRDPGNTANKQLITGDPGEAAGYPGGCASPRGAA